MRSRVLAREMSKGKWCLRRSMAVLVSDPSEGSRDIQSGRDGKAHMRQNVRVNKACILTFDAFVYSLTSCARTDVSSRPSDSLIPSVSSCANNDRRTIMSNALSPPSRRSGQTPQDLSSAFLYSWPGQSSRWNDQLGNPACGWQGHWRA